MRKLVIAALAAGLLGLVSPSVQAHGTCVAVPSKPQVGPGISVFTGKYDCAPTNHLTKSIGIFAQRRPPGGSWTTLDSAVAADGINDYVISVQIILNSYNCAREYRTRITSAHADPGGHSSGGVNGPVQGVTC